MSLPDPPIRPPRNARVLIVDDETRLREVWQRAIGSWGFQVAGARSGEEALKLAAACDFDVAVLDLNLPFMGGIELFERLRAAHPHIQVVIVTGFGDLESARAAIRLDVVDFIQKPCPLGELEQALFRATQRLTPVIPIVSDLDPSPPAPPAIPPSQGAPTLHDIERDHILAALRRNDGNRTTTAQELGISRRTLQYKLSDYQRQGFDVE